VWVRTFSEKFPVEELDRKDQLVAEHPELLDMSEDDDMDEGPANTDNGPGSDGETPMKNHPPEHGGTAEPDGGAEERP